MEQKIENDQSFCMFVKGDSESSLKDDLFDINSERCQKIIIIKNFCAFSNYQAAVRDIFNFLWIWFFWVLGIVAVAGTPLLHIVWISSMTEGRAYLCQHLTGNY